MLRSMQLENSQYAQLLLSFLTVSIPLPPALKLVSFLPKCSTSQSTNTPSEIHQRSFPHTYPRITLLNLYHEQKLLRRVMLIQEKRHQIQRILPFLPIHHPFATKRKRQIPGYVQNVFTDRREQCVVGCIESGF